MTNQPRFLDLTPLDRYGDGSPRYKFHTSYPTKGVRKVGPYCTTPEAAFAEAEKAVREYCAADPYGNMGEALGVVGEVAGYRGVINTYHSNT